MQANMWRSIPRSAVLTLTWPPCCTYPAWFGLRRRPPRLGSPGCTRSIRGRRRDCRSFSSTPGNAAAGQRHRGGPQKNLPENCLATFENTLRHTFAVMEIDPRYTKDGAIVLHHDAQLERTTTGHGLVAKFTLQELKQLRLKDPNGTVTEHQIPTLDEALEWARGKTILILDQKDVPVAARVRKIEEHKAEASCSRSR